MKCPRFRDGEDCVASDVGRTRLVCAGDSVTQMWVPFRRSASRGVNFVTCRSLPELSLAGHIPDALFTLSKLTYL